MIIYKITNTINNKIYIGQTVRTLDERMAEHYRHNVTVIDIALNKYGKDAFKIDIIDRADSIEELNEKEIYWIKHFDCMVPKGYNQCYGGENTMGYKHKELSKKKMSDSKKNMYFGNDNPFYGKTHSEEQKQKWRDSRRGMKHLSNDQIEKLRKSHHKVGVLNVDTGEVFDSIKIAAKKYNLKDTHITRVCKGKRKTTGGYRWEYINNDKNKDL